MPETTFKPIKEEKIRINEEDTDSFNSFSSISSDEEVKKSELASPNKKSEPGSPKKVIK